MSILDTIKLEFSHSVQEMELILAGLRKLPMEIVEEFHNRLKADATAQFQAKSVTLQAPTDAAPAQVVEPVAEVKN